MIASTLLYSQPFFFTIIVVITEKALNPVFSTTVHNTGRKGLCSIQSCSSITELFEEKKFKVTGQRMLLAENKFCKAW